MCVWMVNWDVYVVAGGKKLDYKLRYMSQFSVNHAEETNGRPRVNASGKT